MFQTSSTSHLNSVTTAHPVQALWNVPSDQTARDTHSATEARAGISRDGNNFLRLWMNHNPSASETIYPYHRCNIHPLFTSCLLQSLSWYRQIRDSMDLLYKNCTKALCCTRGNANVILLQTALCHSTMLLLTCTHNNKNLWAFTSSCYIIYETMIKL